MAGAPSALADLSVYSAARYEPLEDLDAESNVDRYAAVKALRYRQSSETMVVAAIEGLIQREEDPRVALEAAGCAASLGSELGQVGLASYIWDNDDLPDLRMEAVFILTELGSGFARDQLRRVASNPRFMGDEIRQAAVWGLGKAGLKSYEDLLPYIDDADEGVAIHAICAFDSDTPGHVLDCLVGDLVSGGSSESTGCLLDDAFDCLRKGLTSSCSRGRHRKASPKLDSSHHGFIARSGRATAA